MDTPDRTDRRDAQVVKDDLSARHGLAETPADDRLGTRDLARVAPETPTSVPVKPLGEAAGGDQESTATADAWRQETGAKVKSGAAGAAAGTARAMAEETGPLFSGHEANELRAKWDAVQVGFVDAPRDAVEHADNLVAETMKRLAEVFSAERTKLEGQWNQGEDVSTEDLRLALRRYRSFFGRLLSI
jgi:hypothetical protein